MWFAIRIFYWPLPLYPTIDNLIYLLLATNHNEFLCVCVHMCTGADMYVCTCMWGSEMLILDVIPQDSSTDFIAVGYFIGLGLAYWARLAGLCLPSTGNTVCLAFLCGCCGIEIRASCKRPVIVSIHKLRILDFNFLLWFSFLFHRHTLTCLSFAKYYV